MQKIPILIITIISTIPQAQMQPATTHTTTPPDTTTPPESTLPPLQGIHPPKSPNDNRQYQALTLPNGLKLLLIHDEEIAKSACSISVGVGSLFDRDRSLGLAHFLEHMLFMGSVKFPGHNQYSEFISRNSGADNAYTSDKETNYYFQVKNDALVQAVQRMTNFFTGALLKQQCIEKQSQAVHEQYVLWTNDDNCRKWQVIRKLASPPYSRFNIGNNQTLRHEHIRDDLVSFYNQYYSANLITAVVCSNLPIAHQKPLLLPYFLSIPNKQVELPQMTPHYSNQQTGKLIKMQSIKDESYMEFFIVVELLQPLYRKHVASYVTHVLGHQGKNSLLSVLKLGGLASQLGAYDHDVKTQTIVGVEIKLTKEGEENYQKVYNIVADFLSTLRASQTIFQQIKQKKQIKFDFKQKQKVSEYVCQLSSKLHHIPIQQILNHSVQFQPFDQPTLNRVLGQLNPFNSIVVLSSSAELQDAQTEKYLGARYRVEELPAREKSGIVFGEFPGNPFIPIQRNLVVFQGEGVVPRKILGNVWFLENSAFRVCKGGVQLKIYSEQVYQFNQFYSTYLQLLLKQLIYPAEALDCDIQFSQSDNCLVITVSGFTDTVSKLLTIIADNIHQTHDSKQSQILFDIALNNLIEQYENFYNQESDQIAGDSLNIILKRGVGTVEETLEYLEGLEYGCFTKSVRHFWENNRFQWVVVGNFKQETIKKLVTNVESKIQGKNQKVKLRDFSCIKVNHNIVHQIKLQSEELSSSCAFVYYQAGPYSPQLHYKLLLLKNFIDEPYFNELRTQKQLAYYLAVKIQNTNRILGLKFLLVSSTRNPKTISHQIKSFINTFLGTMHQKLSAESSHLLTQIKQSIFTKIHAPHNNMKELFEFVTQQIGNKTYEFSKKDEGEIRRYVDPIRIEDLQGVWGRMRNACLEVWVVSRGHEEEYGKLVGEGKGQGQGMGIQEIRKNGEYWGNMMQCE